MRRNATGTRSAPQIGCCRKGSRAWPLGPPQFVEPGVGNAEMVSHLMDHRLGHDVEQLPLVLGDRLIGPRKTVMRSGMAPP